MRNDLTYLKGREQRALAQVASSRTEEMRRVYTNMVAHFRKRITKRQIAKKVDGKGQG